MFRPTNPAQASQDKHVYIPPHIENAMADHMRQTLPSHLKKYQNVGTYVPEHVANAITEHMESSLPSHMKQYAGAYMQQRVLQPSPGRTSVAPEPSTTSPGVTPHAPAANTSFPGLSEQADPDTQNQPAAPEGGPSPSLPTAGPVPSQNQTPPSPDEPYGFITDPVVPPKPPLLSRLPGNGSLRTRIGLAGGSLLVLIILFAILKSLLTSGPDFTPLVTVIQDQQEMIHIAGNATQQQSLSTSNQDFAATLQVTMASSQNQIISYLITNHKKVKAKELNLKVSATIDNQLADAAAATTYDQTFQEIMQAQLKSYTGDLQQAYNVDKGPKGRALLKDSFRQAQLLQIQLNSPVN